MFFLLRMAFWLGVVCVFLPNFGSTSDAPDAQIVIDHGMRATDGELLFAEVHGGVPATLCGIGQD
jgi:hypothetical protein